MSDLEAGKMGKTLKGAFLGTVGLWLLSGCSQIGNPIDMIDGKIKKPDEFEVVARKPLQMPTSLNLPVPQLGQRSPLEPNPSADAVAALMGPQAAPLNESGVSAGELALLDAANARASDPEIRRVLEEDSDYVDPNEPYEPPPLSVVLGLSDEEDKPVEDALDPEAEALRLQAEGVAPAPVDPVADAEVIRKSAEANEANYPRVGRRPDNQLNKEGEPAFE